ncbi:breast cancer type 2 susceptibility protein homolog isoform X2 [Anneissia japonica]|uniref:breast cancer type 2 susceptibility protein homolog isoform X2 n=1 Tax=Anneissia japonica TaxID=1529436 RepID=UPI00142593AB|nr:breast cancer type 2 susceptibility protein homolog isoform X2 [Anneissia japonica]
MDAVSKHKFSKKTCCSGQIPLTLIKTTPCSQTAKPSLYQSSFFGIYKERCQDGIGFISHDWFSTKAHIKSEDVNQQDVDIGSMSCLAKDATDFFGENHVLKDDFTFKTPNRRLLGKSKQLYSTPVLSLSSSTVTTPSLFSPDEQSASKRNFWNTTSDSANIRLTGTAFSPSSPGSSAFTPNQASTSVFKSPSPYVPSRSTSALTSPSPFAPSQSFSSGGASFTNFTFDDDSSTIEKQRLIKNKPGGGASHLDISIGLCQKASSLGMDHDANLSWTSSLATPPINSSGISCKSSEKPNNMRESPVKHQSGVIARALFTDNNVPKDTWIVDSQNTTDLFDLEKTSSDEDEKEMTVEIETLEATLKQHDQTLINENQSETNSKESQSNCEGFNHDIISSKKSDETGLDIQQLESEETIISNDHRPVAEDETSTLGCHSIFEFSKCSSREKETEKLDGKDTSTSKLPDYQTLQIDSDFAKHDHLESSVRLEVFPGKQAPENKVALPSTASQDKLQCKFSPDGNSNIADTLAFLLDTPPERQQKLSKKKPPQKGSFYKWKRKRKRKASIKGNKGKHVEAGDLTDTPGSGYTQDSLTEEKGNDGIQSENHNTIHQVQSSTNNLNKSHQTLCTSNMPKIEYPIQDNKKAEPILDSTCVKLGSPVSSNSDGAMIFSPKGVDPFSQISPTFADALCRATDAVSTNVGGGVKYDCSGNFTLAKSEIRQNKDFILNRDNCNAEEDMCNMLVSGATVENLRYKKESNTKSVIEACVNRKSGAKDLKKVDPESISTRRASKSSFMYPPEMQKLLPNLSRTRKLFDTFFKCPTRPSFTYSAEESELKKQSPKRCQWMKNATIVKEDSDEEDKNVETTKAEGEKINAVSLPIFQEQPKLPVKKEFVTFTSFFDDEVEDKSRNTISNSLVEHKTTPVSRKKNHLPVQRKYRKYQPHSKKLRTDEIPERIANMKDNPDMIPDKKLPLISRGSDHSIERNDIIKDIPMICNVDCTHISDEKPQIAKYSMSASGTRINISCDGTLKTSNLSTDNVDTQSRADMDGLQHITVNVVEKPLECLKNVHSDVMLEKPEEPEDNLINFPPANEKDVQSDFESVIKKNCEAVQNLENATIDASVMDSSEEKGVTKATESCSELNNMNLEVTREDLSYLSHFGQQKQNSSNLEDLSIGSELKSLSEPDGYISSRGKEVIISNSSLGKTNSLIASTDPDMICTKESLFQHQPLVKNSSTKIDGLGGFSCAGGKQIIVSEKSWKHAQSVVSEVNADFEKDTKEQIDLPSLNLEAQANNKQLPAEPMKFKPSTKIEDSNEVTNCNKYALLLSNASAEKFKIKRLNTSCHPVVFKKDSILAVSEKENNSETTTSKEAVGHTLKSDDYLENFDDDFVSDTQAEKEIAAADEAEMVYAFMQEEVEDNLLEEVNTREKHDISSVCIKEVTDHHKYKHDGMFEECRVPKVNYTSKSTVATKINEDANGKGCANPAMASLSDVPQGHQASDGFSFPDHHMEKEIHVLSLTNDSEVPAGGIKAEENLKCNNAEENICKNVNVFASAHLCDQTLGNSQNLLLASVQNVENGRLEEESAMQESTDEMTTGPIQSSLNSKQVMNFGFQTAGGVKVAISEKALRHVRGLVNQDGFEEDPHLLDHVVPETSESCTITNLNITLGKGRNMIEDHANGADEFPKLVPATDDPFQENSKRPSSLIRSSCSQAFNTVSGKSISISESALQKVTVGNTEFPNQTSAISVLSSAVDCQGPIPAEATSSRKSNKEKYFVGFMTGNGRKVNISEEALKKVKQDFVNEDVVSDMLFTEKRINASASKPDSFLSGKGQTINVSQSALEKVKLMLDNEEVSSNLHSVERNTENSTSQADTSMTSSCVSPPKEAYFARSNIEKPFVGFMTGKGEKLKISEDVLSKVKQNFADFEKASGDMLLTNTTLHSSESNVSCHSKASPSRTFVGFRTGNGIKVNISEDSFRKVKQTFDNENLASDELLTESKLECIKSKPDSCLTNIHVSKVGEASSTRTETVEPCVGFMTGNGDEVNVSEDALRLVKQAYDNDDVASDMLFSKWTIESKKSKLSTRSTRSCVSKQREASDSKIDKPFVGFMTGKGEKVKVSDVSLKKVKLDFDDEINPVVKKPFIGFLTGKGEKVHVSDDAIKKVKFVFEEEISSGVSFKDQYAGFQSGSGTTVSVSAKSLNKTKQLLDAKMDNALSDSERNASCIGFLTGRGKKVSISDNAIMMGKKLLNEATEKFPMNKHLPSGSVLGFKTARGSKVDISDDAIKHARGVLQDQMARKNFQDPEVPLMSEINLQQELQKMSKSKERSQSRRFPSHKNKTEYSKGMGVRKSLKQSLSTSAALDFESPTGRIALAEEQATAPFKPSPETIFQDRSSFLPGNSSHVKPLVSQPNNTRYGRREGTFRSEKVTPCHVDSSGESSFITPFKEGKISRQTLSGPQPSRLFDKPRSCKVRGHSGAPFAKKLKLNLFSDDRVDDHQGITELPERSCDIDGDFGRLMRDDQLKRIQAKKSYTVKPQRGNLRQKRQSLERIKLSDLVDGELPRRYDEEEMFSSGVLRSTVGVTAASAEEFQFIGLDHFSEGVLSSGGIQLADGGTLIFDGAGRAGKKEFYNALMDTPGVDPRFVTPEWVYNHYRWIVWKLASMERSYPMQFGGRSLTPESTLLQLKYRYDREVDESQRSSIKRITERDDTPSKTLVLCVAAAHDSTQQSNQSSSQEKLTQLQTTTLELTDGWYSIHASLDSALQRLVKTGKLVIGQKIIIHGAELIGSQDACPPLEAPSSLRLKISANSTRRARYDAKLGYQRRPQAFPVLLPSIYADGGMVGCLDVLVVRTYPLMYMEKLTEGGCVFRTEKSERKAAADYSKNHQKRLEEIYDKIRSKFENTSIESKSAKRRRSLKLTGKEIAMLQTGGEIHDAVETAFDPNSIEMYLTPNQLEILEDHRRSLMDKRHADMQTEIQRVIGQENGSKRTVTPLMKVRLVDYNLCERSLASSVLLTVWRPAEEVVGLLREGQRLKIFNVNASAGWCRDGLNRVQLASSRCSRYKQLPTSPGVLDVVYPPRQVSNFAETFREHFQPDYQEMDIVGLVMYATPYSSRNSSRPQTVYLSDSDVNVFALKFWGGMKAYFVEEIMEPGSFICVSNLQWRGHDKRSKIACGYVNEMTIITQNPKMKHLKTALQHLQDQIKDPKSFIIANGCVIEDLSSSVHQPQTPVTPYIQPSLPPPPPLSTPRPQGTRRVGQTLKVTPSPGSFQIPQGGRTSAQRGHAFQVTTPVVPRNKLTTPKSQDFRSHYSKRLYSKGTDRQALSSSNDQKTSQDNQEVCGQVETPRSQHQGQIKSSRIPLVSTPANTGVTFPLFTKKTLITPKSQNFSSYYKNNALTATKSCIYDNQTTPSFRGHLTSTPLSAKKEKQLLMNSIRFETLSRIPSPPPLEPLINLQSGVLAQSYKMPLDVLETSKCNIIHQVESIDIDDLELQALDAGFSNRTLALDDSGDFDFSETSPKQKYCQKEEQINGGDKTNLSPKQLENTSGLSQISDIPTQVLRDLDLSGLEEIASSASSMTVVNDAQQDTVHQISAITELSETVEGEIDVIQMNSNDTLSQRDGISCSRKRKRESKRGMYNECFELSQEVASLEPKDSVSLLHLNAEFQGCSRRVTRSISKKVLEK